MWVKIYLECVYYQYPDVKMDTYTFNVEFYPNAILQIDVSEFPPA